MSGQPQTLGFHQNAESSDGHIAESHAMQRNLPQVYTLAARMGAGLTRGTDTYGSPIGDS